MTVYAAGVQSAGPRTVQGLCSCGWSGPERTLVRMADEDIREHLGIGDHFTGPNPEGGEHEVL